MITCATEHLMSEQNHGLILRSDAINSLQSNVVELRMQLYCESTDAGTSFSCSTYATKSGSEDAEDGPASEPRRTSSGSDADDMGIISSVYPQMGDPRTGGCCHISFSALDRGADASCGGGGGNGGAAFVEVFTAQ